MCKCVRSAECGDQPKVDLNNEQGVQRFAGWLGSKDFLLFIQV